VRHEPPHGGLYVALAVVSLAVAVASAVAGEPRWASAVLLLLAALMVVLVLASRRRRVPVRAAVPQERR
jgi:uncharacterized membrane protein YqjE